MVTRRQAGLGLVSSAAVAAAPKVAAQERETMNLPPPRTDGGKPLIQALGLRRSIREYDDRALPPQVLSDLLWAAFGINRPATGDRTAPYWRHVMVIDVYAAMADGVWLYEPKRHVLLPHLRKDLRAQTGLQDFVATAPLNLIYVAHGERMRDISAEDRRLYASVDAAFIGQNVYLFCASEGLATVFRGAIDYRKLIEAMQLGAGQFVTFAQTVGYPGLSAVCRSPSPRKAHICRIARRLSRWLPSPPCNGIAYNGRAWNH
jgi:nitroreductase